MPSRKSKGGSHTDKNKNKKRRREPTIEILENPITPVEVQSPAEDETAAAVQELLNELNQIQVEDYSTPSENVAAFTFNNKSSEEKEKKFDEVADKKKNEMSLDERFKKAVKSVEVFDTVEDFEKYLNGEKRKKVQISNDLQKTRIRGFRFGLWQCVPCAWRVSKVELKPQTKKTKRGRRIGKNGETEYHVPKPGISEG